jgi:hypothetical protein
MGRVDGYRVADYLHEHALRVHRAIQIPGAAWRALAERHHAGDTDRLGLVAELDGRLDDVETLARQVAATAGESVRARVRCDADTVVPGQRTRVAVTVWAGEPVVRLDDPVALRVMLDAAPAEVHPVSRVTVLTDDRMMVPVDFEVVPEAAGPLPLVFRIYREADSHLLLEVRADLPVEVVP